MGLIGCCNKSFRGITYTLQPDGNLEQFLTVLKECPCCNDFIIRLDRMLIDGTFNTLFFRNKKGLALYDKLKPSIIQEKSKYKQLDKRWYLPYNEYGSIKKCFSILSSLKIGLFDYTL